MIFDEIWQMHRRHSKMTTAYRKQVETLQKDHTEEQVDLILQDAQTDLDELSRDILIAESDALVQQAHRLKMSLPSRADKEAWDDFFGPHVLKPKAYTDLRSAIRQERKERREAVISLIKDIISPIGGMIISILSLLIAYAALKLKH